MKPKLLPQRYKTFGGAAQRAAFERGVNPGEFARGYARHLYSYRVVSVDGLWRVERSVKNESKSNA
jgi:hypothetical protein